MVAGTRRQDMDNLRWMVLLLLIPYHAAMAWNVWGEPNYIFFRGNRWISSSIVFISPWFMPLLFLLAGISTKFALEKRSGKAYLAERAKRLLIPCAFGTLTLMPMMTYLAERFYGTYPGSFFNHYSVFFTRYTDLIGADGGFSFGQFWFLLYLFLISLFSLGILKLLKETSLNFKKAASLPVLLLMGLPLPLLHEILSIGGKSFAEYTYFFLVGYFIFANPQTAAILEKNHRWLLALGLISSFLSVYLFIWSGKDLPFLNLSFKYVSQWSMVLALLGLSKKHLNFTGRISEYMGRRSILFYFYHFIWVVISQYTLYKILGNRTWMLYGLTLLFSYAGTFLSCEISIRIPALCFLTGVKYKHSPWGQTPSKSSQTGGL